MKMKLVKRIITLMVVGTVLVQSFPVTAHADNEALTGKNAFEITQMMEKGWNLGNTFDATGGNKSDIYSQETSWGNPVVTKELIDGVKAAGFTTIRIPITWARFVDKSNNYAINPEFMARIKQVVDWAYEDGLFIIINVHHESWVNRADIDTAYPEIGEELGAVWAQVSEEFADYDQHLIFEGMNEPRAQGTSYEWTGNAACYDAVNALNQIFVETVRANGKGYNNERVLMIPGYAASCSSNVLRSIKIPEVNGAQAENVAVSVHCYNPYNFCLTDNQNTFDPQKSSDTDGIKQMFKDIDVMFTKKGIATVIGECGCTNSGNNNDARLAWFTFFGNLAAKNVVPAVVWDNGAGGTTGGECHKYFNRKTGEAVSQDLIDAFLSGSYTPEPEIPTDIFIDFEPYEEAGETILVSPDSVGFTSNKLSNQMKINHTEGAKLGLSMKVDKNIADFTAKLDISRYKGIKIRISAWISSKEADTVFVGTEDKPNDMITVNASEDWQEVVFDYEVPAEGSSYLVFKGNESLFYVDDISITMNPTGEIPVAPASDNTSIDEDKADNGSAETVNTDSATVSANDAPAEVEKNSVIPTVMIGVGVVAVAALLVIILGGKKKK